MAAKYWKGWMWYWIYGTYIVKHLARAAVSESSVLTDAIISNFSISFLNTLIYAFMLRYSSKTTFFFNAANSSRRALTIWSRLLTAPSVGKVWSSTNLSIFYFNSFRCSSVGAEVPIVFLIFILFSISSFC